ncbi:MAG: hypothetical protein H8D63_02845 [Parcubacteria group bacterium]|nr:hypothetical protein [Parcubacteria group bacterium]
MEVVMGLNADEQRRCLDGGYPFTTCRADANGNIIIPEPETEKNWMGNYIKRWHVAKPEFLERYLVRTGQTRVCAQAKSGEWFYLSSRGEIKKITSPARGNVLIVRDPNHLHPAIVRMEKERRKTTRA